MALTGLAACGGDSGKPTLNWYINPDGVDTFIKWAEKCSTDDYTIAIQSLPTSATDQRVQLARRLAAEDSTTDLMNLDPVFVAEFANAGWLAEVEGGVADEVEKSVEGDRRLSQGCGRHGHLGGRGLRLPAVGEHPGPLVPASRWPRPPVST